MKREGLSLNRRNMLLVGMVFRVGHFENMATHENQDGGRFRVPRKQPNYKKTTPLSYAGEPKPRIPAKKKIAIIARMKKGDSECEVARTMKISKSSVANIMKHYKKYGNVQDRPRSGRPRKISPRAAAEMRQAIKTERVKTTEQCLKWLRKNYKVTVSPRTVRNVLKTRHCRYYIKQSKPFLTEKGPFIELRVQKNGVRSDSIQQSSPTRSLSARTNAGRKNVCGSALLPHLIGAA